VSLINAIANNALLHSNSRIKQIRDLVELYFGTGNLNHIR